MQESTGRHWFSSAVRELGGRVASHMAQENPTEPQAQAMARLLRDIQAAPKARPGRMDAAVVWESGDVTVISPPLPLGGARMVRGVAKLLANEGKAEVASDLERQVEAETASEEYERAKAEVGHLGRLLYKAECIREEASAKALELGRRLAAAELAEAAAQEKLAVTRVPFASWEGSDYGQEA